VKWPEVRRLHAEAVEAFAAAAAAVPPARWLVPRAEGKWSPAEIVEHLTLAYDTLLRELEGGPGMKVRTKWWQRILLRFTLVPRLLRGEPFPAGARAPREIRPTAANPDQVAAVARFRELAARIDSGSASAIESGKRVRLTHAYFGSAALWKGVLLCARHVQHHTAQLRG
jgi:hypothetical protein